MRDNALRLKNIDVLVGRWWGAARLWFSPFNWLKVWRTNANLSDK